MKLFALLVLALLITPWDRAARLAERGDLPGAEREYRALLADAPDDPDIHYNLGTVLLLDGRYEEARPHLESAAAHGSRRAEASYNLGGTDLQPAFDHADLPERDARLRRAIDAYKEALRAAPEDADAKWNLELARRLLERDTPPPPSGGGGGGGGGQGPPESGEREPAPLPAGGSGPLPDTSEAEAEELLSAAQEREVEVQRDRLRRTQPPGPIRP